MCEECLSLLLQNLTKEEFLILDLLKSKKCVNPQLTLDKTTIIPGVKGLTEFKFNNAVSRLELVGCIKRITTTRLHKFYITSSGTSVLQIYKKELQQALQ